MQTKIGRHDCQRKNSTIRGDQSPRKALPGKILRIPDNFYFAAPSFQIPLSMSDAYTVPLRY
jgi:hypothetical protein